MNEVGRAKSIQTTESNHKTTTEMNYSRDQEGDSPYSARPRQPRVYLRGGQWAQHCMAPAPNERHIEGVRCSVLVDTIMEIILVWPGILPNMGQR